MLKTATSVPLRFSALLLPVLLALSTFHAPKAPRLVARLPHPGPVEQASFGAHLVTSDGTTAVAWDPATGAKVAQLVSGERNLRVRHGNGGQVATVGFGGVTLFDKKLERVAGFGPPAGLARDAAFSSDGKLVALGFEDEDPPERHDGGVVLHDAATGKVRGQLPERGPIFRVEFRKDGKRLMAESVDRTGTFCKVYDGAGNFVKAWYASGFTWSPDGKRFALVRGKKLEVYSGDETQTWSQSVEGTRRASFSADGRLVLAEGARSTSVFVFDAAKGKLAGRLDYRGVVLRACLHPKKPWVLAALEGGEVSLRDVRTGQPVMEGLKANGTVNCLAFDATGRRLAVGEQSGVCSLWEIP